MREWRLWRAHVTLRLTAERQAIHLQYTYTPIGYHATPCTRHANATSSPRSWIGVLRPAGGVANTSSAEVHLYWWDPSRCASARVAVAQPALQPPVSGPPQLAMSWALMAAHAIICAGQQAIVQVLEEEGARSLRRGESEWSVGGCVH